MFEYADGMQTPSERPAVDPPEVPQTPEYWEQARRSVAMLSPGAWAMRREHALQALGLLVTHLRLAREHDSG